MRRDSRFRPLIAACLLSVLPLSIGCTSPVMTQPSAASTKALQEAQQLGAAGKHAEAEAILAKVVEQDPRDGKAWLLLGSARHTQKRYESALVAHLKAAEFPAFKPIALYNAACVYALTAKPEQALETLKLAVAAGFADSALLASDPDLASVRRDPRFSKLLPPLLNGKELFKEPAQILRALEGEGANHEFGWVARKAGDLDGDSAIDFVVTAPGFGRGAGKVYVYSSRSGKLLFTRTGQPGNRFGNGAAGAGDVNRDGTPDVVIGAPFAPGGLAEVLSGKDGSVLHSIEGSQRGGQFGFKVCGLGDVDGDGHADVGVSAPASDGKAPGSGRCFAYSGKTGKPLFSLDGDGAGDKFGSAIAASQDPKHSLLAIGAQDAGEGKRGRVYVYRLKDGVPHPAFTLDAEPSGTDFGQMFLSFPGDLNRDGVPDVYCSDFSDSSKAPGAGSVFVYSGADGKKLLALHGAFPGEGFGTSPGDAGDADGDGVGDLIVGAWQNREVAPSAGKVYLHSGADGRLLTTWTCRQAQDTFGFDATGLGDVNGDGRADFLVTSAWSAVRGPKTGRVFVIAGPKLLGTNS